MISVKSTRFVQRPQLGTRTLAIGDRFRVVADESGRFPVRYMRRKGTILEVAAHRRDGLYNYTAYRCKLDFHKDKVTVFYNDEIEKLEDE